MIDERSLEKSDDRRGATTDDHADQNERSFPRGGANAKRQPPGEERQCASRLHGKRLASRDNASWLHVKMPHLYGVVAMYR